MTVPSVSRSVDYTSNGSQTAFTVPFAFIAEEHLRVSKITPAAVETVLTLGVDYTVTGEGGTSGTVTLTTAATSGHTVRIQRVVPYTQLTSFKTQGVFSPLAYEQAYDLLTQGQQQLSDEIDDGLNTLRDEFEADPLATVLDARTVVATGSTKARTLAARFAEIVNVKDHDATGDGVTEDTVAIQAAITRWLAGPKGSVLYFPPGEYLTDELVMTAPRDRVIRGAGWRTIVKSKAGKSVFVIEGEHASPDFASGNISFENLFIYQVDDTKPCVQVGGRAGATIRPGDGLDQPVTGIHFLNCWFQGGTYGIHYFDCYDAHVIGCEWEGSASYGIKIESGGRLVIAGSVCYDIGSFVNFSKHAALNRPHNVLVYGCSLMLSKRSFATVTNGERITIALCSGIKMGRHTAVQPDLAGVYVGSADVDALTVALCRFRTDTGGSPAYQKLAWGINIFDNATGPTNISLIGNDVDDANYSAGKIQESVGALRQANAGDTTVRFLNSTAKVILDNGLDLRDKGRLFIPRHQAAAAPTGLDDYELYTYCGKGSLAGLPPTELVYQHPTYGTVRVALLTKIHTEGTAAPATGTWARGAVVWNTEPSATGWTGWICVTAGTPGTWKGFGAIEA